jgi:hypothetical protein
MTTEDSTIAKRSRIQYNSRTLLVAVAAVVIAIALLQALVGWIDPYDNFRFVPNDWKTASPEVRAQMSRNLVSNHLHTGMTKANLVSTLGEPDEILTGKTDAGANSLPGSETYSYYIGSWSAYGYDDAFVYIHLDSTGKVQRAEINGY